MTRVRRFTSFERRSLTMTVSIAAMAAGGVAFNAVAARAIDPEQLGLYASLFFWLALINNVTSLGLPTVVSRLLRYPPAVGARVAAWSFAATAATSVIGVASLVLLADRLLRTELAAELRRWPTAAVAAMLCSLAAGVALSVLVEIRLVALGMHRLAVARSLVTNLARCGLVLVPALQERTVLVLVASIGTNAASGIAGAALLTIGSRHVGRLPAPVDDAVHEVRTAGANWLGGLALVASQFAFPILTDLSPAENAAFYLAWQSMAVVFLLITNIGVALTIDAAPTDGPTPVRSALSLCIGFACAATAGALLLATPIEAVLFTPTYPLAVDVLPILLLAAIPWSVTTTLLAVARARGRHAEVVVTCLAYGVSTALALAISKADAPRPAAVTWLVANAGAMVAAVLVNRATRRRHLHS